MIKVIEEFPEYAVSDRGDVYSLKFGKFKELNKHLCPVKDRSYYCVNLSIDGRKKIKRVHELMASTFLEKPNADHVVNFKDNNPENIRIDNLEYVTRSRQALKAVKRGTFARDNKAGTSIIGIETAIKIFHEFKQGGITRRALAQKYLTNETTVSEIISGRRYKDAGKENFELGF